MMFFFFLNLLPVTATLVWSHFLPSGTMALFFLFWILIIIIFTVALGAFCAFQTPLAELPMKHWKKLQRKTLHWLETQAWYIHNLSEEYSMLHLHNNWSLKHKTILKQWNQYCVQYGTTYSIWPQKIAYYETNIWSIANMQKSLR